MIVLTFVVFPSIAVRAKKGKKKTLCGAAAGKSARAMQKTEYSPDKRLNILRFSA
jgi:hypothetical protein